MLDLIHNKLEGYKISLQLVKEIYAITNKFPIDEKYILSSQLKRAATSVCSNLAEGSARISDAEKKRFYEIARISLVEVETQVEIALVLDYLSQNDTETINQFMESVFKMLLKLISNLTKKTSLTH